MVEIRYFTVKLLDGTPITARNLRDIKKLVGNAPFIPANAETVDYAKLRKRLKIILLFFMLFYYSLLGGWLETLIKITGW